ncbi:hypothetical protein D3C72_1966710 [compost metagenome]
MEHSRCGMGDLLQRIADAFVILAARGGELDFTGRTGEKRRAQIVFEQTNLTADRALSDV